MIARSFIKRRPARQRRPVLAGGWARTLLDALAAVGRALGTGLLQITIAVGTAYALHTVLPDVPLALP